MPYLAGHVSDLLIDSVLERAFLLAGAKPSFGTRGKHSKNDIGIDDWRRNDQ
jgi:hypothetical protein